MEQVVFLEWTGSGFGAELVTPGWLHSVGARAGVSPGGTRFVAFNTRTAPSAGNFSTYHDFWLAHREGDTREWTLEKLGTAIEPDAPPALDEQPGDVPDILVEAERTWVAASVVAMTDRRVDCPEKVRLWRFEDGEVTAVDVADFGILEGCDEPAVASVMLAERAANQAPDIYLVRWPYFEEPVDPSEPALTRLRLEGEEWTETDIFRDPEDTADFVWHVVPLEYEDAASPTGTGIARGFLWFGRAGGGMSHDLLGVYRPDWGRDTSGARALTLRMRRSPQTTTRAPRSGHASSYTKPRSGVCKETKYCARPTKATRGR